MSSITIKEILRQHTLLLHPLSGDLAPLEARVLLCDVLLCTRADLISHRDRVVSFELQAEYEAMIERRLTGEPVSKILGVKEFWGIPFKVTKDTLDPRPDTETLIEGVLGQVHQGRPSARILDLGTGTGCLLLTLLHELTDSSGVGVDISPDALIVAQENAKRLNLEDRSAFLRSDWGDTLTGLFDIIVSNPPYITEDECQNLSPQVRDFDPPVALNGGIDGLDCYRKIGPLLHKHLALDGFFAMEIGINQECHVEQILNENNLVVLEFRKDLAGIIRCIIGQTRKS
jgi:release factor glutamine methyltransferase